MQDMQSAKGEVCGVKWRVKYIFISGAPTQCNVVVVTSKSSNSKESKGAVQSTRNSVHSQRAAPKHCFVCTIMLTRWGEGRVKEDTKRVLGEWTQHR